MKAALAALAVAAVWAAVLLAAFIMSTAVAGL